MEKLLNLKFKGGDITKITDLEKTFGKFYYLGSEPLYYYDEENQQQTDELVGYDMLVLSEQTKKPYKVKFNQINVDFTQLKSRDIVELIEPTIRLYHDGGALTNGATLSISAVGVKKMETSQVATDVKKQQEKGNQKNTK